MGAAGQEWRSTPEWRAAFDAHELWVRTDGREGRALSLDASRLDLSGADLRGALLKHADLRGMRLCDADLSGARLDRADLRGAHLAGADLSGADLSGADLREADLSGANLRGADLARAQLQKAALRKAVLRDARLAEADLSEASGLLAEQFGGANLAGATLPAHLAQFDGLANVAEVSKATQTLLTSIVFVCAYTWLTIASTADAQLLNNAAPASSKLPILGIDIPLVRFYMVAPVLLLCLYAYFQLSLQRLWEELADLPAVFTDGRAVDKKAYPWLLNILVRNHLPRLRPMRTRLMQWQARFSVLLAWGLVPLTILLVWARYLRGHDWGVTGLHIAMLAASAGLGIASLKLASATLRGSERRAFHWRRAWGDARALGLGVGFTGGALIYLVSLGAIEGINPESVYDEALAHRLEGRYRAYDVRRWLPRALNRLGLSPSAALTDANLSTKPANWTPNNEALLEAVHGGDLEHRNLRHALAFNAFGVNAYLQEADLRWADLRESDLRRADFRRALLHGTNFRFARLKGADFRRASLIEARLNDTDSCAALFEGADLRGATFGKADLRGANLKSADLRGADLSGADLSILPASDEKPKRPTILAGALLERVDFSGADLSGADLSGSDLRGARLAGAKLDGAQLQGADLTGSDLTPAQWSVAVTDAGTRPPEGVRAVARRERPNR